MLYPIAVKYLYTGYFLENADQSAIDTIQLMVLQTFFTPPFVVVPFHCEC